VREHVLAARDKRAVDASARSTRGSPRRRSSDACAFERALRAAVRATARALASPSSSAIRCARYASIIAAIAAGTRWLSQLGQTR
jgi:hypothetical protein